MKPTFVEREDFGGLLPIIIVGGFVYLGLLGFRNGLPTLLEIDFGILALHQAVGFGLALIGWLNMSSWPVLRRYLRWAWVLATCFCLSSIAAWDVGAIQWSVTSATWLVFVVPGLASLLRVQRNRLALLVGALLAALNYAGVVIGRLALGRSVFDLPTPARSLILGLKRGQVMARLTYLVPFLFVDAHRVPRRVRWPILAAVVTVIVVSGSRAGLLVLAAGVLTLAVLQPGSFRKARAFAAACLLGLVLVTMVGQFGGAAVVAQNRVLSYFRGERTDSDEHRELQIKRAWNVGWQNPLFGIGLNNLEGVEDPVLNEARTGRLKQLAQEGGAHTRYAQLFAEFGPPATLALVILLFSLVIAGFRHRHRPEVRAATAGLVAVMMIMLFDPIAVSFLYLPLAYMLGVLGDPTAEPHPATLEAAADTDIAGFAGLR